MYRLDGLYIYIYMEFENRWDRCVQAQSDYLEGDGGN